MARTLAANGYDIAVIDIDEQSAREAVDEITTMGRRAIACPADVSDRKSVQATISKIERSLGPCIVVVNNAGWERVEPFLTSEEETWDRIIGVNLKGTINVCHEAGQYMAERNTGRIINIASDAGRVGSKGEAVYSGTKGGIIAFSKALAREFAKYQITVNVVCPGPTETNLFRQTAEHNPHLIEAMRKSIPLRRIAKPQDVANAVAFFATDEAEYITGQVLSVSGGLTMVG